MIGAGVTVSSGAVINGSVVLDGASIGEGARVLSSAVGRFSRIGADTVLDGAVVGDGVRIGARNELRAGVRVWPEVQLPDGGLRFSTDV